MNAEQTAPRALVPWDLRDEMGGWPDGLPVGVYAGDRPAAGLPATELSTVEFYVVPYDRAEGLRLIPRLPALRVAQSLMAGTDQLAPLLPPGVVLCNGRGLHDASTAEHALALILAAQRELPARWADQARHRWDHRHTGSLADRRVLILGYGSIGRAAERRLSACEAEVIRVAGRARPAESVHGVAELAELLPAADIVLLILPDTPATAGLLDARLLARLPDHALVVNVGRGRTLDTDALVAEVSAGRLRAALDVTDPEPLPPDHPLWTLPDVLITPHVAGGSATFYPRARRLVADQLRRYASGQPLRNVVATG